ncbi:putative HTH transcriptional regulator [Betafusellovirus yellowstonense]|uniref:Putative HTH transcriptional regulator n=1 Tax=Betafusellovirus yellowstonense TaxID=693629 RepID=D1GFA1_9VIRU|nr:transcriptional regulator [Acidianus spindle-shaped virus 1]ACZ35802.1 putative HTH transcriptional regulator [Acidianus spindle-shaped virus 1]
MKSNFITNHALVIRAIFLHEGCTVNEALKYSTLAPNTFYKTKEELVNDGFIEEKEEQEGRIKKKRLYLTEKGQQIAQALLCLTDTLEKLGSVIES